MIKFLRQILAPKILVMGLTLTLGPIWPVPAAQADVLDDVLTVNVLTGWREADGRHIAGLQISLAEGWKTYWRAPGDAGIPPRFQWEGSRNLAGVGLHWPVPDVFWQNTLRSVGYDTELVLPLLVQPVDPSAPVVLSGEFEIGVCEEVCIPAVIRIEAVLPPKGAADPRLAAALADRPMTRREAGVKQVTCSVQPIEDGLRLTVQIDMPTMAGQEAIVVETADPSVWSSEPALTRKGNQLQAVTDLVPASAAPFALDRSGLRITVLAGGKAVDILGCSSG